MRYSVTIKDNFVDFKITDNYVNIDTNNGNNTDFNSIKDRLIFILKHIFSHIKNNYKSTITYDNITYDLGNLYIENMELKLIELNYENVNTVDWVDYYNVSHTITKDDLIKIIEISKVEMSKKGTILYKQKWNNLKKVNDSLDLDTLLSNSYYYEI